MHETVLPYHIGFEGGVKGEWYFLSKILKLAEEEENMS